MELLSNKGVGKLANIRYIAIFRIKIPPSTKKKKENP
jgi:hypothetical protein